jgi:hypothetical protein
MPAFHSLTSEIDFPMASTAFLLSALLPEGTMTCTNAVSVARFTVACKKQWRRASLGVKTSEERWKHSCIISKREKSWN